ncbi:MAG TPA: PAS domain S-box protein [Longimicrobiaceae bacterium]|nr:PAS domain S-box protein [Longimicrobiaceae bacterium]
MRALLADTDTPLRAEIFGALRDRGWAVTLANDAGALTACFQAAPFPLVVLAHPLADGDGLKICRAIRESAPGRSAYVLLVAREPDAETVRTIADAGVDDLLTLPAPPRDIHARIALAEARLGCASDTGEGSASSYLPRIRELEGALQVQRAWLEELFESAPEGIAVVDENDRVLRLNGEFTRMFGYTSEEALGRPINDLIAPYHLMEEAMRITRSTARGERQVIETVRRHRDGQLIDVSLLATPIRVGDGCVGAYGIYRDITERKAHERALRQSEARYRALFDQSPVGVFLCDLHLRVTRCNDRLPEILGVSIAEIVGVGLREPAGRALLPGLCEARVEQPVVYEGLHSGRQGARWFSVRYAPLRDPDGVLVGGMGVVEDITGRELAKQQERAQAAELERVNAALRERTLDLESAMSARNRLYTSMNHELRTPISAIMLYQELLLSGSLGELPGAQKEALQNSHTAAQHLLELVQDVLDLAKVEAGKMRLNPARVEMLPLLEELLATVRPLARRYGSEVHLEVLTELPALLTDPQRVRQILLNLISNAAKFGLGRPIRLRCFVHPCPGGAPELAMEVRDEGIGISAEDLPNVFEDFVQVGAPYSGGTGLGLAISRRLAELLQGRLEAESELGAGSTFRLILPTDPPGGATRAMEKVLMHG